MVILQLLEGSLALWIPPCVWLEGTLYAHGRCQGQHGLHLESKEEQQSLVTT